MNISDDQLRLDALSRTLPFLLQSTTLPPLTSHASSPFGLPDHPYSLFEGLAGAVCTWSDACVVIQNRIKELTGSESNVKLEEVVLGLPGVWV